MALPQLMRLPDFPRSINVFLSTVVGCVVVLVMHERRTYVIHGIQKFLNPIDNRTVVNNDVPNQDDGSTSRRQIDTRTI